MTVEISLRSKAGVEKALLQPALAEAVVIANGPAVLVTVRELVGESEKLMERLTANSW